MTAIRAVTFDWYGTLVHHREKVGRGRAFIRYLSSCALRCDAWSQELLYDTFEYYGDAYHPALTGEEKGAFWTEFTRRLFERANVQSAGDAGAHADAIRDIFGSSAFELFPEVQRVLAYLKARGLRLGVISNWPRGLEHFCAELGVAPYFDAVVASGEVKRDKPDPVIFAEALRRLGATPDETVHVGDLLEDDVNGARSAGMRAILLDREHKHPPGPERVVHDLSDLGRLLWVAGSG